MDRHEDAVQQLLTANGETFVAPKYEVVEGWVCPSLVALRPSRKQVLVVEVSASGYPLALVHRINARWTQWYAPLLGQLQQRGVVDADWAVATVVVVRDDQADWLRARIEDASGVQVLSLEQASSPWLWGDAVWSGEWDCTAAPIPTRSPAVHAAAPAKTPAKTSADAPLAAQALVRH